MSRNRTLVGLAASLALLAGSTTALAQVGTAFTYQGQLKDSGVAVNAPADLQFSLWTAASGGSQVGSTVTSLAVPVNQGLFTNSIDFGVNPYTADQALYLQIAVRTPAGSGPYTPMGARQKLTGNPFSMATRGLNVDSTNSVFQVADTAVFGGRKGNQVTGSLTIQAPGTLVSDNAGSRGGNLVLKAGNCNASAGSPPPVGTSLDNNVMIYAGDNTFCCAYGDRFTGHIQFFAGHGLPERMRIVGDTGFLGVGTTNPTGQLQVQSGGAKMTFNDSTWAPSAGGSGLLSISDLHGADRGFLGVSGDTTVDTVLTATGGGTNLRLGGPAISFYTGANAGLGPIFSGTRPTASMTLDSSGNLGVGAASAGAKLAVTAASGQQALVLSGPGGTVLSSRSTSGGFTGWDTFMDSNGFTVSRSGIDFPFHINATSGAIGMGTTTPTAGFKLDVSGNIRCVSLTQTSSREFKQDIVPLTNALDSIMKLNGVSYAWNDKAPEQVRGAHDIGFIADEMNQVLPDIVAKDASGKPIGIDYGKVTPVAVEAIKQLKNENDLLKARLEKLEALMSKSAK